ncbi:MAG: hydroxymethylglutaryl-CoA lyase [Chitinophagales bacterium]
MKNQKANMEHKVKIIECPRDAMQGIKSFIPTERKIAYINSLLEVGFDTIDAGSFVSPHVIPQMADTALVLSKLNWSPEKSKLLAIIANVRGAREAAMFDQISFLGFPFSVSETFQQRNTNASMEQSFVRVEEIQNLCIKFKKQLVIYISMGFGNPYGDEWSPEIVIQWVEKMIGLEVRIISLADTIGVADPKSISGLFRDLIPSFPATEFGTHLHTTPESWREKTEAAFKNGCRRFDGAIKGYGGCPMSADELKGNMPTENLVAFFEEKNFSTGISKTFFNKAMNEAVKVFD